MQSPGAFIEKQHPHPIAFFGFYFGGIFFFIAGFFLADLIGPLGWISTGIGALVFFIGEISRRAETFYILEAGVERGYQLLSTDREFIDYAKIQDLDVDQSLFERMFGVGDVNFDTAGTSKVEMRFYAVRDPYRLERIIREKMGQPTVVQHADSANASK